MSLLGFVRAPGTARQYRNVSNPDYAPGTVLSRRQFDNATERAGLKRFLATDDMLADTRRRLELLNDSLTLPIRDAGLEETIAETTRIANRQEAEVKIRTRSQAGSKVYRQARDIFRVRNEEETGKILTAKQADKHPEMRELAKLMKQKPSANPNIRAKQNNVRRRVMFQMLNMTESEFWETYRNDQGFATQAAYNRHHNNTRATSRSHGAQYERKRGRG